MTTAQKIIKTKVGILDLAKQLGKVSQACRIMGYSRDSFYQFKELYDQSGEEALREVNKRSGIASRSRRRSRLPSARARRPHQPGRHAQRAGIADCQVMS